jgi:hypothetical protein
MQSTNHAIVWRSYWIPGSWHVRMVYTEDLPLHDPRQESNGADQYQDSDR